jgi:hypothetical protein
MGFEVLELTRRGYEAWNRGDERWFLDRLADGFVLRFPPGFFVLDEIYRAPVTGTVAHRFRWERERLVALTVTPPGEAIAAAGLRD